METSNHFYKTGRYRKAKRVGLIKKKYIMEENDDEIIVYNLESGETQVVLQNATHNILDKLKKKFGNKYEISSDELAAVEKEYWSHNIKIRQGNKIGAEVSLKWVQTLPSMLKIEVDESSKMGNYIFLGIIIPFMILGGYMGSNDIEPLAFLPGRKIAGALGAVIAFIPATILASIVKSLLLKDAKQENAKLINEVREVFKM